MAKWDKRLEGMRNSPQGDWKIEDVEAVCGTYGVGFTPGNHAKVSHSSQAEILTVPFHRPIKAIYIKRLVKFIDSVIGIQDAAESQQRAREAIEKALSKKEEKK
jgi:hypothetical protein